MVISVDEVTFHSLLYVRRSYHSIGIRHNVITFSPTHIRVSEPVMTVSLLVSDSLLDIVF